MPAKLVMNGAIPIAGKLFFELFYRSAIFHHTLPDFFYRLTIHSLKSTLSNFLALDKFCTVPGGGMKST
jgi:hypothetical protein